MKGLTSRPKSLPPRYFYDAAGSALFERITQLPEYYLTRAERQLITMVAPDLVDGRGPQEIVELGSGSPDKIRPILDASTDRLLRYVPLDLDEGGVWSTARAVADAYPRLQVIGVVGDFERHLGRLPARIGRRLIAFFGSTSATSTRPNDATS